ncbi:hypothetical protein SAMN05444722_2295 [Rhodovulum sp. ES.010]|uniref:hypothetical protein n=1 Tax=Rhodovulum sp. ES.010 TaxID=1882821 RepID=UPI00092C44E2|nr:hypothetical protein [Rhodovulum sp. ES.010]SIO45939.1 hypothetical protein SAMN05444722_2295 [Rhodovulum sp. ES.010]
MTQFISSAFFFFALGWIVLVKPALSQTDFKEIPGRLEIELHDPATSPRTKIERLEDISNEAFRAYADGALGAVRSALGTGAGGEIRFVRIPVVAPGRRPLALPDMGAAPSAAQCSVSSPWAEIAIRRHDEQTRLSAVLIWNERQLLVDIRTGDAPVPPAPRRPYSQDEFERHAQRYGAALPARKTEELLRSELPADLAVLFRRAPQSTLLPFSATARAEMQRIAAESVSRQVEIVARLATLCAPGTAGHFEFSHISEVTSGSWKEHR